MSFIKAGGPKEALSSLIFLELVQSARAFEFAASVVMNNQDVHSFCATVGDSFKSSAVFICLSVVKVNIQRNKLRNECNRTLRFVPNKLCVREPE